MMFNQCGMEVGLLNAKHKRWGHQENLEYTNSDVLPYEKMTKNKIRIVNPFQGACWHTPLLLCMFLIPS